MAQTKPAAPSHPTVAGRAAHAAPTEADIRARLQAFLQHSLGWQQLDKLEIVSISAPDSSGIRTAVVHLQRGDQQLDQSYYISPDGKEVIAGNEKDVLSGDPWAGNRTRLALQGAPVSGPADAAVTVVEFSDLECPYCKELSQTLDEVMQQDPGKFRLVFKFYPLVDIHPWSMQAALAGACVAAQSSADFWNFERATFDHQEQLTPDIAVGRLHDFAIESGANPQAFDACMASTAPHTVVDASIRNGKALGVISTPTLFINGRMIPGAVDAKSLRLLVDHEAQLAPSEAPPGAIGGAPAGKQCSACGTLPPIIHGNGR